MNGRIGMRDPMKLDPATKALMERWNDAVGGGTKPVNREVLAQVVDGLVDRVEELRAGCHGATPDSNSGGEMVTNHRGVKAGKVTGRFDLLPPEALSSAAQIMQDNLSSHGRDTWRKLDRNDHINHAIAHIVHWMNGDTNEHHLAHAMCRLLFANSKLVEDSEPREKAEPRPDADRPFHVVYFSHPCKGDLEGNSRRTIAYVSTYTSRNPNTLPLIPHYMFRYIDEDNGGREAIMTQCVRAVQLAGKIVMCGPKWTDGMLEELREARRVGIPVLVMETPYSEIREAPEGVR